MTAAALAPLPPLSGKDRPVKYCFEYIYSRLGVLGTFRSVQRVDSVRRKFGEGLLECLLFFVVLLQVEVHLSLHASMLCGHQVFGNVRSKTHAHARWLDCPSNGPAFCCLTVACRGTGQGCTFASICNVACSPFRCSALSFCSAAAAAARLSGRTRLTASRCCLDSDACEPGAQPEIAWSAANAADVSH